MRQAEKSGFLPKSAEKCSFLPKNEEKLHFFTILFGQFKKKQYLCTRFPKKRTSKDVESDFIASLAQLVEHVICNLEVVGSSPTRGS